MLATLRGLGLLCVVALTVWGAGPQPGQAGAPETPANRQAASAAERRGPAPAAALPPQPTGLAAIHRAGQTFLTWVEPAGPPGDHYRVYRYHEPITATNLSLATRLAEVPRGSSRFYANRYLGSDEAWHPRLMPNLAVDDGRGSPPGSLPDDTGLLVWTPDGQDLAGASGTGYYAVTTVEPEGLAGEGVENTRDFGAGNRSGAIAEAVADPLPVEVAAPASLGAGAHAFIQYMDLRAWNPTFHAPRAGNGYLGLDPADPAVRDALAYAYDYYVYEPRPAACGGTLPARAPVVLILHAHSRSSNTYSPPGGDPAPAWCAYKILPVDEGETWYFGFAAGHDYRLGQAPAGPDTIMNYTEQRLLRMIYDLMRRPAAPAVAVDGARIYVYGHSMGASGTLALALRYPNVFAAAYSGQPMTDYRLAGSWLFELNARWGSQAANLPVQIDAPNGWAAHLQIDDGRGVWDWQNHQATVQAREAGDSVPFGMDQGLLDDVLPWATQGAPTYAALNASPRSWGGVVTATGHQWLSFAGLPPGLALVDNIPFAGLQVRRDETVPGLANAGQNLPMPPTASGGYNQTIRWSASWDPWDGSPVDVPQRWQISLCAVAADPPQRAACGTGVPQTVDITPRRVQAFAITPGAAYTWEDRQIGQNLLVAGGTVTATQAGLLTVPGVSISPGGNRLILRRAGATGPGVYLPILRDAPAVR